MFVVDTNKYDIDIFINDMWLKYAGDIDQLFKITRQFGFRCWPRESKVELHKTTFSIKSSSNLSPGSVGNQSIGNLTGYRTNDQYCYPLAETMNCSKNKNV